MAFTYANKLRSAQPAAWCLVVCVACSSPKPPGEAAQAYDVAVTDGFRSRGGVAIGKEHVLADLALAEGRGAAQVLAHAKSFEGGLLQKRADVGVGLLMVRGADLEGAPIGSGAALSDGQALTAVTFDKDGTGTPQKGVVTGWRASEGRAYIETDMPASKDAVGSGVFGPDGKLIGFLAMSLGAGLTYVLPVEYVTHGPQAITASVLGVLDESPQFAEKRQAALPHKEKLERPLGTDTIATVEQTYSKSALVGKLSLLDQKEGPASKSVRYRMEALDEARNKRVIAEGTLPASEVRWSPLEAKQAEMAQKLTQQFGAAYVAKTFAPLEYGELRYRLPFKLFCPKVTDQEVHTLSLTLADGRKTYDIAFADLVNICSAQEDGDGTAWEAAWGMGTATRGAPSKKKGKGRRR